MKYVDFMNGFKKNNFLFTPIPCLVFVSDFFKFSVSFGWLFWVIDIGVYKNDWGAAGKQEEK